MNLLFDDTVEVAFQKRFASHHPEYQVSSVTIMGWSAGSSLMANLTTTQQDKLLLRLARQSGYAVFITADVRFHRQHTPCFPVLVCDAGDYAPTLNFWNALAPLLDEQIIMFTGFGVSPEESVAVLRLPDYLPDAPTPVTGSRLASAKLRPIRNVER